MIGLDNNLPLNMFLILGHYDSLLFAVCDVLLEEKQVDCPQNQKDCLLRQRIVVGVE